MKTDYNKEMEKILEKIENENACPRLLLHTCCAPCSTAVIKRLANYFKITVFYYNPNISPKEEYEKRKEEQKRFIKESALKNITLLDCDYENELFTQIAKGLEQEKEGGKRCPKCFNLRLEKTAKKAKEENFDYFGTSLTVSPYKNAEILNKIGKMLEEKYQVTFLPSDFKKKNGYKESIELSKKYHLYRQDYCGCIFSKEEREQQKKIKLEN